VLCIYILWSLVSSFRVHRSGLEKLGSYVAISSLLFIRKQQRPFSRGYARKKGAALGQ